jgi:very-short-patch-repair endonuclease
MSIDLARDLRQHSTWAERLLWHWLRHRYLGGYKFRRQHPFASYVLDFYCVELRLCLEVDGGVHDEPSRVARDEVRTRVLEQYGVRVVRIRNESIREQPDGSWDFIVDAVVRRASERECLPYEEVLSRTLAPRERGEGGAERRVRGREKRPLTPTPLPADAGRGD